MSRQDHAKVRFKSLLREKVNYWREISLFAQVNQEPLVFSLSANRLSKYLLKER